MWTALNHGERVSVGDTIRFRSRANSQLMEAETLVVIKTDQFYFEVVRKADHHDGIEQQGRRFVRYIDIGYNVLLERWTELEEKAF